MKKSTRRGRALAVLNWGQIESLTATHLAELAPMDEDDAARSLHELYLEGQLERTTDQNGKYSYRFKKPRKLRSWQK